MCSTHLHLDSFCPAEQAGAIHKEKPRNFNHPVAFTTRYGWKFWQEKERARKEAHEFLFGHLKNK